MVKQVNVSGVSSRLFLNENADCVMTANGQNVAFAVSLINEKRRMSHCMKVNLGLN